MFLQVTKWREQSAMARFTWNILHRTPLAQQIRLLFNHSLFKFRRMTTLTARLAHLVAGDCNGCFSPQRLSWSGPLERTGKVKPEKSFHTIYVFSVDHCTVCEPKGSLQVEKKLGNRSLDVDGQGVRNASKSYMVVIARTCPNPFLFPLYHIQFRNGTNELFCNVHGVLRLTVKQRKKETKIENLFI